MYKTISNSITTQCRCRQPISNSNNSNRCPLGMIHPSPLLTSATSHSTQMNLTQISCRKTLTRVESSKTPTRCLISLSHRTRSRSKKCSLGAIRTRISQYETFQDKALCSYQQVEPLNEHSCRLRLMLRNKTNLNRYRSHQKV